MRRIFIPLTTAPMKTTFILFLLLVPLASFAQRPVADIITTSKGTLQIQPVTHGTLVLSWNGKTIYVDPYGGAKAFEELAAPDLILITDIHGDHLNLETLKTIQTSGAMIVAPTAVVDQLAGDLKAIGVTLNNGETISKLDIAIKAIPMYNLPESPEARHTKGRGNGYVLTFGDKIVYLSGDTAGIPEMRALKNIDVAFVCMNLPYTMGIEEAASAVLEFKPKIVYPYHYRGQGGLSDVESFKKLVNTGDKAIDVRLRNWYPEYP
jgi:L-ascorbate metabolism protein UlaG (beta-lactamase superfamily)